MLGIGPPWQVADVAISLGATEVIRLWSSLGAPLRTGCTAVLVLQMLE